MNQFDGCNKTYRLGEYKPTTPCEYCLPRKMWEVPDDGIYVYERITTVGRHKGYSLAVYGGSIVFGNALGRSVEITHCPHCGRRLGE